ncbi:MAG: esterase-like activity of phytase family protein [Myxococcota bacterium]
MRRTRTAVARLSIARVLLVAGAVILAACGGASADVSGPGGPEDAPSRTPPPERLAEGTAPGYHMRRIVLDAPSVRGLSGLTRDDRGEIWGVTERQRMLVRIHLDDADGLHLEGEPVALVGIPDGADAESLAWLGEGRFALGTETTRPRAHDEILVVQRGADGGTARVERRMDLSYEPWLLRPGDNQGIEALCDDEGALVAASEVSGSHRGRRFAPVARLDRRTGEWARYRVRLTSRTGKLAAVACRRGEGGVLEAVAIERHFGVVRLLRFELPPADEAAGPAPVDVESRMDVDLMPFLGRSINLEGLVWLDDGRLWLLSDNDSGGVHGDTEALVLTPTTAGETVEGTRAAR